MSSPQPQVPEWMQQLATPPTTATDEGDGYAPDIDGGYDDDDVVYGEEPGYPDPDRQDDRQVEAIGRVDHADGYGDTAELYRTGDMPPVPAGAFSAEPINQPAARPRMTSAPRGGDRGPLRREELLGRGVRPVPASGWRRAVFAASFGSVNLGENPKDVAEQALNARINAPVCNDHKIAVASLKGGVGKSTTTIGLGAAMATVRTDRVLALDTNPDAGVLAERIATPALGPHIAGGSTIYDLLADGRHARYSDVRAHTLEADTGLQVVASHDDPARSAALTGDEVLTVMDMVSDHYQVIISDCGTGITHQAMAGVLDCADTIVIPTLLDTASVARAEFVCDWLVAHHMGDLAERAVVVINASRGPRDAAEARVRDYFAQRVRVVISIPQDPHLAEGGPIYWWRLRPATRSAYRELAAVVADDFAVKFTRPRLIPGARA